MGKRSHRLDEEDLLIYLTEGLLDRGYMTADEEITGLEFRTKRVKKGGWYHEDASNLPDDQVDVVKWIKVHTAEKRRRRTAEEIEADREAEAEAEQEAAPAEPELEPATAAEPAPQEVQS